MLKIQGIYCEHQKNPATVETDQPGFSWILESDHANVYQKAWRIQVWENGSNGKELAWDSQKRESGRTIENLY